MLIKFGDLSGGKTGLTSNKLGAVRSKKTGKVKSVVFKGATVTIKTGRDSEKGVQTTAHELKHVEQGSENPLEYYNESQTKEGKKKNETEATETGRQVVKEYKENKKKEEKTK